MVSNTRYPATFMKRWLLKCYKKYPHSQLICFAYFLHVWWVWACSSWQLRFQPWAQASCSPHAWVSEPSWAFRHSSSTANFTLHFLPLSPGTTSELQEGLNLSFSWQIVNIVPLTAASSVCSSVCHPQTQPCLHFHGVQGPGRHEPPTRGTQVTLPLESPREGKASFPSAGDHENCHGTFTISSKEAVPGLLHSNSAEPWMQMAG